MKKANQPQRDDLRKEYTPAMLGRGVRGKYASRMAKEAHVIVLEPDVAKAFPDGQSVNDALRLLMKVARQTA